MIDVSIVQTPKQSIKKEGDRRRLGHAGRLVACETTPERCRGALDQKEHGKSYFSYKLSADADKRCKLIRKIKVSTSSEHDTLHFEAMIDLANISRDIHATKAISTASAKRDSRAKVDAYIFDTAGTKENALSEAQERRSRRIASPRARVEHVFAGLAQLGDKMLRSIGLALATLHLNLKAATCNPRRFAYLKEAGIVPF